MENKPNKHFCIQPFVNVTTRVDGQNNVCCNIVKRDSNIKSESQKEFFQSAYVKNLRNKMLNGEKIDDCRLCYYQEAKTGESHRKQYNQYYYIKNDQDIEYYPQILKSLKLDKPSDPLYVEVHISNLCNLKCLTCNERDSSQYHSENKILGISENPQIDYTKFVVQSAKAVESILSKNLLFLDIRGGETLLVPEIKKILKQTDEQLTKKITLKIQTNGTILPDQDWLDIFRKFKNTKLTVSIDAYNKDNEYVRFPSQWSKILDTFEVLKKEKIKFTINTVVSNINVMVIDKLLHWVSQNNYLNYLYILKSPDYFQPTNLPQDLLDEATQRLEKVKNLPFANANTNKTIDKLIVMCKNKKDTTNWKEFVSEINRRDKHRKNTISSIMPEIKEYLNA